MAKNSTSKLGGVVGVLLGLAIVGGLVATPFYAGLLRSDQGRLDQTLEDQIETVRRITINLDQHLIALSDLYASLGESGEIQPEEFSAFLRDDERTRLRKLRYDDLTRTSQFLQNAVLADQRRGISAEGQIVAFAPPDVRKCVSEVRTRYLKDHERLVQLAERTINEIATASVGQANANTHLGANRIRAIFHLTKGRIELNRAASAQRQAAQLQRQAATLARTVAELQGSAASVEGARPTALLADIEAKVSRLDSQNAGLRGSVAQLGNVIATGESRISELENQVLQARRGMAAMEAGGEAIHQEGSQYQYLSKSMRAAGAEAAALLNGTLAGATVTTDYSDDLNTAQYEGGQPQMGVRDMKLRLEQLSTGLAAREKTRSSLVEQQSRVEAVDTKLQKQAETILAKAEMIRERIPELLEQAEDAYLKPADEASDEALKSLKRAGQFAKAAISAASARVREARASSTGATEGLEAERLGMIQGDQDMEASVQCLLAEVSYSIALTRAGQIEAIRSKIETQRIVAGLFDMDLPDSEDERFEDWRAEAVSALSTAEKAYESAATLISRTRAKAGGRTIQGKDYVWQAQVGKAAVHLLHAQVLEDADEVFSQKRAAYDLLKEALEGREQSPLLAEAAQTLVHLQQTVR